MIEVFLLKLSGKNDSLMYKGVSFYVFIGFLVILFWSANFTVF